MKFWISIILSILVNLSETLFPSKKMGAIISSLPDYYKYFNVSILHVKHFQITQVFPLTSSFYFINFMETDTYHL